MPTRQDIIYAFDMRTAVLTTAPAIDVLYPKSSTGFNADMTGGFPLAIPSGLDFSPENVGSGLGLQSWNFLLTEKHSAILEANPGFHHIIFDDMADATGFDMTTASGINAGGRGCFTIGDYLSGSTVTTNAVALSGSAPGQAVIWAESAMYIPSLSYSYSSPAGYSNPKDGRFQRFLRPYGDTSSFLQFDVSFNGGSTWIINVFPQDYINIPVLDQGTSFKLRITRRNLTTPRGRILLGGWALVY